jgi:Fe-S-cluster containining protein
MRKHSRVRTGSRHKMTPEMEHRSARRKPLLLVDVNVEFRIGDDLVHASMPVPAAPTTLVEMLPTFQRLTDSVVGLAVERARAKGVTISCRKGCGACCRQLVPISEPEAHQIAKLIAGLSPDRRAATLDRFARARQTLETAGLLNKLRHPETCTDDELRPLALQYFHLGIACPFLEEEACSIHAERPIACREYLVTSPAANCKQPTPETVRQLKPGLCVSRALEQMDVALGSKRVRWLPLIVAPEWAETQTAAPARRTGPDWLRKLFERLAGHNPGANPADRNDALLPGHRD